jgi:hypothetical protein
MLQHRQSGQFADVWLYTMLLGALTNPFALLYLIHSLFIHLIPSSYLPNIFMLLRYLYLYFHQVSKSDHSPALGSEASPSAPPARSSSLIGASAPRHFLSRLVDKLFFFLYSALPAFIGGSVGVRTYNFFSLGGSFPPQQVACVPRR